MQEFSPKEGLKSVQPALAPRTEKTLFPLQTQSTTLGYPHAPALEAARGDADAVADADANLNLKDPRAGVQAPGAGAGAKAQAEIPTLLRDKDRVQVQVQAQAQAGREAVVKVLAKDSWAPQGLPKEGVECEEASGIANGHRRPTKRSKRGREVQ